MDQALWLLDIYYNIYDEIWKFYKGEKVLVPAQ